MCEYIIEDLHVLYSTSTSFYAQGGNFREGW